jgi:hypothetical protein
MPEKLNRISGIRMIPLTPPEKKGELKLVFEVTRNCNPKELLLTHYEISQIIEKSRIPHGTQLGYINLSNRGQETYSLDVHPFALAPENIQELLRGKRFGEKMVQMALVEARKRFGEVRIKPHMGGTSAPMQALLKRWGVHIMPNGCFEEKISNMIMGAKESLRKQQNPRTNQKPLPKKSLKQFPKRK